MRKGARDEGIRVPLPTAYLLGAAVPAGLGAAGVPGVAAGTGTPVPVAPGVTEGGAVGVVDRLSGVTVGFTGVGVGSAIGVALPFPIWNFSDPLS